MAIIKFLFLAGFILASALAAETKPATAALLVQSNFDYSLTRKEFRVHYSGLGDDFESKNPQTVSIKIFPKNDETEVLSYDIPNDQIKTKKAYHFALNNMKDGTYEVQVCADSACSAKTPSLTDAVTSGQKTISCHQGETVDGNWIPDSANPEFKLEFVGPETNAWSKENDYTDFEKEVNDGRAKVGLPKDFKTDYTTHTLKANPIFKKEGGVFHASITYDLTQYSQLFKNKLQAKGKTPYSHDICERKYFLSAHAHVVNKQTHKVELRFKTTLFLSEGGKQIFVLGEVGKKVLVEITHKNVAIPDGDHTIWFSLCSTEKDAIESTYCADPIIKDLKVEES